MAEALAPLRNLVQICRDGERFYREAANRIRDPKLRETAAEARRTRGALGREFAALLGVRGEEISAGTWNGTWRMQYVNLRARWSRTGDRVYLAEFERVEDRLLHAMERATLHLPLEDLRAVLRRHMPSVRAAHERMRSLSIEPAAKPAG
ncbi:MAG TPA: PA2169 family four-helix-bundle protein [Rhodanobacteraceae bacterium]|nr:PA2169 family four-helix-bundle protein [Rhodanobacteraceae bacterium]